MDKLFTFNIINKENKKPIKTFFLHSILHIQRCEIQVDEGPQVHTIITLLNGETIMIDIDNEMFLKCIYDDMNNNIDGNAFEINFHQSAIKY